MLSLFFVSLCVLHLSQAVGIPKQPELHKRESPCIALGNCPGPKPPTTSSTAITTSSTTSPPVSQITDSQPQASPSVGVNSIPIKKGYVAFGDSYAAGIGTGATEGSGCRQGEFSYPKQLASLAPGIDFQNLPCSGAIVGEVLQGGSKSQIDRWTNPQNADLATLSIGGNDIGFYNILTACVLRVGQSLAGDCNAVVSAANNMISGFTLSNDINSALHQIIDKSGRSDFKIFLTGYPAFFNVDTPSCDYTTFYYYQPDHHGIHRPGNWAYLYQPLRLQLNNLVSSLNVMLSQVANSVNSQYPSQKVWFVDPNPRYNGHRFCEDGVTEPDDSRSDTWLFLSAWGDNSLPGTASAQDANNAEMSAVAAGNSTGLPDPNTCSSTLGQSTDWADRMLCDTAIAVANPAPYDGPNNASSVIGADQRALHNGSFNAVEVPWYVPTRQAKTFHPKTLGQLAYKLAIMDVW